MEGWSIDKIKFYLHYWKENHEHEMGTERDPSSPPAQKRRRLDAYFVEQCLNNACIDEAFGILTPQEQYLIMELYMLGSVDMSTDVTNIRITDEAFEKVRKETQLSGDWINRKTYLALKAMQTYLNNGDRDNG